MTPAEHRAAEARRLLDEPLLNEALDKLEHDAIEEILRLPFWSDRKRRMMADRIRVIRSIRGHLRSIVLTGVDATRGRPTVG